MNRPKISQIDFLNFFFPIRCIICERITNEKNTLCIQCSSGLKYSGVENNVSENDLAELFKGRIKLYQAYYHFKNDETGFAKKIVHEVKYKANYKLIEILGSSISDRIDQKIDFDWILPVPLNKKKLKQRGFNQSRVIAEKIFGNEKIIDGLIERTENTKSQTGFGRFRRWGNMETAFEINTIIANQIKPNAKILIVDDVVTTGSTVEAIMVQLRNYSPDFKLSLFTLLKA